MLRQRRRAIALFLFLSVRMLAGAPAQAADWPVPRGPSHEPMPYRYDAAAWKQVPKAFLDDAAACTLYSGTSYLVEADGTIDTITHEITRFNGRKSIEKLGEYRNIAYDPAYQTLTLNEARVLKADGRRVPIEPKHVQLRDLSTDYQVYDHEKQLIISFPNLEVGDAIEVKWTTRGKNPEHQGQFFTRYTLGDDHYPVVLDELRVRVPKDRPLRYATTGEKGTGPLNAKGPVPFSPVIREEGNGRLYQWQAKNRPQLPQDDNLPSKEDLRLQVSCSTFASWEDVRQWKGKLRDDCWECTAEIRKVVAEVTKGLQSPEEKVRALTYWVRRNIRYVSAGEKHDYTPHAPCLVFANRFGDCKDQSQLLAAMLRAAGVPAGLATLGTLDDGQVLEAVPSPWGTHAILRVPLDGTDHWIDTTVSLAAWDYLPHDDRDRLCYVVDDQGIRLVRTPPLTPESNRTEQTTHVSIGPDGSSRCERTSVYHGNAALSQRDSWMDVPSGERRRLATSELQDANSRARLCRLAIDEAALRDFNQPVRATLVFEIPGHFTGEADDRDGSLSDSKVWGKLISYNLDDDRPLALDLYAPFESRHRYVVDLPPAYKLDSVPKEQTVRSKWGSFTIKVLSGAEEPGKRGRDPLNSGIPSPFARRVEFEFHTRLEQTRVEPADFEAFHKFHEELTKQYRVWLTLKPVRDLADAPALETLLALTPGDSTSAAILAKLYQQHGKTKDALRVLQRARYYQPDDAALWELTAKAAETDAGEEGPYRELIRRFPDEPKYAVALGTTLVNRGEHGKARAVLEPVTKKGDAAARGLAHYQLARSSYQQNQPAKALKHFKAAEDADADSIATVAALKLKGQVYEKLGRTRQAILSYETALILEPDAAEVLLALIPLELAAKKPAEALDHLRRYTVAAGSDGDKLLTAAEFHLRLQRHDDAFDLASRAGKQQANPKAEKILGLVHLQRGEYEQAVACLDKADAGPEVLPGLVRASLALGKLGHAQQQVSKSQSGKLTPEVERAIAVVKALVERSAALRQTLPTEKAVAWQAAIDAYVCAEYAHAEGLPAGRVEALLASALSEGVDLGPAYGLRGLLALEKGRLVKAAGDAEQAVRLSPQEARGYYVRGRVRLERGTEGALADLAKAAELSRRKEAAVLHWLAAALAHGGQQQEALATQREAVKLKPADGELLEQLKEFERGIKVGAAGQ